MHDVQRGAARRRRDEDCCDGFDADTRSALANVDENRTARALRELEDLRHLVSRRAGGVFEAHADTERTGFNLASQRRDNSSKTLARSRLMSGGTGLGNDSRVWPEGARGERRVRVPVSGSVEIRAIVSPRIPTSRTASRLVSGSMTRPDFNTRSNDSGAVLQAPSQQVAATIRAAIRKGARFSVAEGRMLALASAGSRVRQPV